MSEWDQIELLIRASEVLAESQNEEGLLQGVLRDTSSYYRGWSALYQPDEQSRLALTQFAHVDPKKLSHLRGHLQHYSEGRAPLLQAQVFESQKPRLISEGAIGSPGGEVFRTSGCRSGLVLPLSSRLKKYGILMVGSFERAFEERDQRIGKDLADRTGLALDRFYLLRQLENEQKARDSIISITSHDIRVPLTSLKLLMELLSHILRSPERLSGVYERVIDIIQNAHIQVDQSTALLEQMLAFSRIETGTLEVRSDSVDLVVVIAETQAILRPQLERAGVKLEVSCAPSCMISGDAVRLRQVLVNLVTNSIKYAGKKRVFIDLVSVGTNYELRVIDHGRGISPEFRKKIFDRFDRGTEPCDGRGHGLGLYISRKIIESHRGRIWAEESKPRGSTFVIELPQLNG